MRSNSSPRDGGEPGQTHVLIPQHGGCARPSDAVLTSVGGALYLCMLMPCLLRVSNGRGMLFFSQTFVCFADAAVLALALAGVLLAATSRASLAPATARRARITAAACVSGGILLSACPGLGSLAAHAGGVLFGFGLAVQAEGWVRVVARRRFGAIARVCALGVLGAVVVIALLNVLPAGAAVACFLAASVGQAACLWRLSPCVSETPPNAAGGEEGVRATSPADFVLTLTGPTTGIMLLVVNSLGASLPWNFLDLTPSQFGVAVASACALAGMRLLRGRLSMALVNLVIVPACSAFLLVLASLAHVSGLFLPVNTLCVFAFFSAMALLALANLVMIARQGEFRLGVVVGLPLALAACAALAGRAFAVTSLDEPTRGAVLACFSTLFFLWTLLVPAIQLWRSRRAGEASGTDEGRQAEGAADVDRACDALADTSRLSPREAEVFRYLARGYNSPYIAQALVISESTVRSHAKSIYRKLGVSSHMELLDLVRGQRYDTGTGTRS